MKGGFPLQAPTANELLHNADAAMYHAKRSGKANYQFYRSELEATVKAADRDLYEAGFGACNLGPCRPKATLRWDVSGCDRDRDRHILEYLNKFLMKDTDTTANPSVTHAVMANAIRLLAADAVQKARSGHPGMPMGMADVATVLFTRFLKYDAADPKWPDRDRFVLSAGHGSMLLYALMYLTGYPDITMEQIKNFRQLGSIAAGHPEHGHASGAETTTGPLGQGLANAVGMALAERLLANRLARTQPTTAPTSLWATDVLWKALAMKRFPWLVI